MRSGRRPRVGRASGEGSQDQGGDEEGAEGEAGGPSF